MNTQENENRLVPPTGSPDSRSAGASTGGGSPPCSPDRGTDLGWIAECMRIARSEWGYTQKWIDSAPWEEMAQIAADCDLTPDEYMEMLVDADPES